MSIFGKVKGLLKKNKKQATQAVDKAADVVESKVGEDKAEKVEEVAEKVKDAIEKVAGDEPAAESAGGTTSS